jgi:hypothetical protein
MPGDKTFTWDDIDFGWELKEHRTPVMKDSEFPGLCPLKVCGKPAYVGLNEVECSGPQCPNYKYRSRP